MNIGFLLMHIARKSRQRTSAQPTLSVDGNEHDTWKNTTHLALLGLFLSGLVGSGVGILLASHVRCEFFCWGKLWKMTLLASPCLPHTQRQMWNHRRAKKLNQFLHWNPTEVCNQKEFGILHTSPMDPLALENAVLECTFWLVLAGLASHLPLSPVLCCDRIQWSVIRSLP